MKRKFIKAFFELIPLGAGLLVVTAKPAPHDLAEYLSRYMCFVALFIVWGIFRTVAMHQLSKGKTGSKTGIAAPRSSSYDSVYTVLLLATLAALFIGAILVFNHRFERIIYEFALALIGINAFAHRFKQSGRYLLFYLLLLIYHTGVGFLSFQMVLFSWQWQAAVFAFVVATVPVSIALSDLIGTDTFNQKDLLRRLLSITLVLGPAWLSLLVFRNELNNFYLAPVLYLPFISRVSEMQSSRVFYFTALICLALISTLAILGFAT